MALSGTSDFTDILSPQLLEISGEGLTMRGLHNPVKTQTRMLFRRAMMSIVPLAALIYLLIHPSAVHAANILAIQSISIPPYNDSIKGFENACACEVEHFVLSEMKDRDLMKDIREARPNVVLAVGFDALNKVKDIKNIPIIYMMALNPQPAIAGRTNIAGVSMNIDPAIQLTLMKKAMPGMENIGVLYNPARTEDFLNKARTAAAEKGIRLIAIEVHNTKDIPPSLKTMEGRIDAFWMLSDLTAVTRETLEFLFLFTIENRIPVITFSDRYLEIGAMLSIEIDAYDVGKQAWDLTKKLLSGKVSEDLKETCARETHIAVNQKIARKLGITIGSEILDKAKVLN